ncbi:MAG TPA: YwiC-like family protein [Actinomycetota bacterium]|nr:YwiC-like family protein [Actinomycetota bacterium]
MPKEHGASFMSVHSLLLGIVAGFAAGGDDWTGLALAVAFGTLFLPLTAAISVITQPRLARAARGRAAVLAMLLAAVGVLSLVHGPTPELLWLGGMGVVLGGLYAASRARTGGRSVPSQVSAIASITLLAPLAWLLVAGGTDRWPLAAPTAFLGFAGSVPYVRERVRRRRLPTMTPAERIRGGWVALMWQVVALAGAVALSVAGVVHPLVPLAFVPGAIKVAVAIVRPETRPPIKRIGYLETAISTAFAVLAGIGLGIAP